MAAAFCAAGILASVGMLLAEPVRVQNIPTAVCDDAAWASFVCVLLALGVYFTGRKR